MDPDRIHAYLQAACAGLGFDVGEVWFSSPTTVLPHLEQRITGADKSREIRFLQLYTSKTFKGRRNDLLKPENEIVCHDPSVENKETESTSINKHVLSPMLVNAIASNAQVVWANCPKQEGLLGRSDMRLQTAVGMPVAMDGSGNMCIVVMFSPRNVQSNKDAMEYIKLISQGAASSNGIPCLLPVVDNAQKKLEYNAKRFSDWQQNEIVNSANNWNIDSAFSQEGNGQGVGNGQALQLTNNSHESNGFAASHSNTNQESQQDNEFTLLPIDQYGIPILPEFAELSASGENRSSGASSPTSEDLGEANEFDSATYGLWSSIMNSMKSPKFTEVTDVRIGEFNNNNVSISATQHPYLQQSQPQLQLQSQPQSQPQLQSQSQLQSQTSTKHEFMKPERKNRLEEFTTAFLGLSVFDLADVWVPATGTNSSITMHNVFAVSSSTSLLSGVSYFKNTSRNTVIKGWCGAVGRAQCTGNPVWSTNQDIIVDSGRKDAFIAANIKTALAVPIFSQGASMPCCVLCCYSMVRSDSVTFILKFLQQALRSLWAGLDHVEPHESIGKELWKGVAPADLGEMAADTEMQKAFYKKKKRPYEMMDNSAAGTAGAAGAAGPQLNSHVERRQIRSRSISMDRRARSSSLALQLQSLTNDRIPTPQQTFENTSQTTTPTLPIIPIIPLIQTPPVAGFNFNAPSTTSTTMSPNNNTFTPSPQMQQNYALNPNPLPTPTTTNLNSNDFREDLAVAKSYIDTINALVQQNGRTDANNIGGQNIVSHQNIPNNSTTFAPESTASSEVAICPIADTPTQKFAPTKIFPHPPSGKVCRIEGCNILSVSRRPYCTRHSGNRLCEYKGGCTKCAQGATRFCIAHGGGRRCTFPGCDKGARDKFFCAAHGGGKRCNKDGCSKSAVGGSSLCTSHGGGRRCSVDGCEKSAQSSTKFCVKHGGGKKCAHPGCGKVARGRTMYCAGHGGGVRCKLEGCSRIAIGKMQLCRAHGGGSGRAKKAKTSPTVAPQQPFLQPSSIIPTQPTTNSHPYTHPNPNPFSQPPI